MPILQHSRYKVFSKTQHPFNHSLTEFLYSNASYPEIFNVEDALNAIFSVLYPQTKGVLDTYAELPAAGNNNGDFYTVTDDSLGPNPSWKDDGDHSQGVWTAGYIWHKYDGDVAHVWHKQIVYDWAVDDVVSELISRTANVYIHKRGLADVDENGDTLVPALVDPHIDDMSGQSVWGGTESGTHLTLNANNGDAVGETGYVQFNDEVRPTKDNYFDFGKPTNRFKRIYTNQIKVGNEINDLHILNRDTHIEINSDEKDIDFVNNALRTTARISAGVIDVDNITINNDRIFSDTGQIDFDDDTLLTSGLVDSARVDTLYLEVDNTTIDNSVLTDTSDEFRLSVDIVNADNIVHAVEFQADDATNQASLKADSLITDADNFEIDSAVDVTISKPVHVQDIDGLAATFESVDVDFINIDGQTINATHALSDPNLVLNSDALISVMKSVVPLGADIDLGALGAVYRTLYIEGYIGDDDTNRISIGDLLTFKAMFPSGIADGHALFWNGTLNRWEASAPDTEIDHRNLLPASLTTDDAGHTQFVMLAGRTGGQFITGGPDSADRITLRAYDGATNIELSNTGFTPSSGSSINLGADLQRYNDIFTKGQFKGGRAENVSTLPAAALANKGRMVWNDEVGNTGYFIDNGGAWVLTGLRSYKKHDFTNLTILAAHDVSPMNAMDSTWQVKQVSTGQVLGVTISVTNTNEVTVSVPSGMSLDVGSAYSLVGVEA